MPDYLSHHGIKGQKWGIRRFQNKDGSWTAAGRERYGSKNVNLNKQKEIVSSISAQVEADSKPPTGNQNCKLCTWCAEAQFRGIKNALPRPVYSPQDPELFLKGVDIVKGAKKVKSANYKELQNNIISVDGDARFYAHVNWKDSTGGHEFLIIKNGNKNFIMDAQAGTIEPMTSNSSYLTDINYDNSYIARLDDKPFNAALFNKTNDRKNTRPFIPKDDIPYMYKKGMISKEEYEAVMKNPNLLYGQEYVEER